MPEPDPTHGNEEAARSTRRLVADFTLRLIKTLLQTSAYTQDHPLAAQATADLYGAFQEATAHAAEVSYIMTSAVDERGVMVEGLTPEPIEVAKTFRNEMGEHFVGKFHDYFLRNRIASFTIRREIERAEFERFIQIWVGWGLRVGREATGAESAKGLFHELTRHGVLRVNIVGLDEMLGGHRQLPWNVKISLSRIRNDLSRFQQLKSASAETHASLSQQAVSDVLQSIPRLDLIRDVLLNLDLVAEDLPDVPGAELIRLGVEGLSPVALTSVVESLQEVRAGIEADLTQVRLVGRDPADLAQWALAVVKAGLVRLARLDFAPARSLLLSSHERGLVEHDILPKTVQRRIKAGRTTVRFIEQADAYLGDLATTRDPTTYLKYLNVFVLVLPELAARNRGDLLARVFDILARHQAEESPFPGRTRFIHEMLANLESGGFMDQMVRIAVMTPKESREPHERAVAMFGEAIVPGLVASLASLDDASYRKATCSMLVRIGSPSLRFIMDELRAHRHAWYTVRNLIQVLGEIGDPEAIPAVVEYSAHPNAKVREECLAALAKLGGGDAESLLLRFLEDREESVVRRAIHHLAGMRATSPAFLERLHDLLRVRTRQEADPPESLQAACLRALMEYEKVLLPPHPDFEALLHDIIAPPRLKSMLPGRLGIRPKSDSLVLMAIEALGFRGGKQTEPTLHALAAGQDRDRAQAAARALDAFRRRREGSIE